MAANEGETVFVATNHEGVYCIHLLKLLSRAPNSWFAKAILGRAPGDTAGSTQERPLFLPVPSWFVRGVADWCMPMSTGSIFFEHPHDSVVELLTAMCWPAAEGGDLPVHLPKATVPLAADENTRLVNEIINETMPGAVTKACGYSTHGVWRCRHRLIMTTHPGYETSRTSAMIGGLPQHYWDIMSRILPVKSGETQTMTVGCSNGVHVVTISEDGNMRKITIASFC